jgi:deoxyribose-phosphate aldolase
MKSMNPKELASRIDHTLLKVGVSQADVEQHCREAIEHGFRSVILHTIHLKTAAKVLEGSGVILGGVVSFPHGATSLLGKVFEALEAWKVGAVELDFVLNLSAIASGDRHAMAEEVRMLMEKTSECTHKFIVEVAIFSEAQMKPVFNVMNQRRPAFVKTSTGVNTRGASVEDVKLLRSELHESIEVKASGGIRTLPQARALLEAGATVLGTSSGVDLIAEASSSQ